MGYKKQGAKKQDHCYSNRKEASNNDPDFLHPAVFNP